MTGSNFYGVPKLTYAVLNNVFYHADGNGLITNVQEADEAALIAQGCISEMQWLKVQAAHPTAGGGPFPFFGTRGSSVAWSRPALATFSSWLNQTDASGVAPITATATDNVGGLPLVVTGGIDTVQTNQSFPTCLLKPAPSIPWTITVALASFSAVATAGALPIVLYDSADDKLSGLLWYFVNSIANVAIGQYSNASNHATCSLNTAAGGAFAWPDYFAWFRIDNDGTTRTYSISPDGFLFKVIYHELSGAFLGNIDKVGFGYDRFIASSHPWTIQAHHPCCGIGLSREPPRPGDPLRVRRLDPLSLE
jgi:hypothetical protein